MWETSEVNKEKLKERLYYKWAINRSFMSEEEFEKFIKFKLKQELYQEAFINRVELYENIQNKVILDVGCGEGGLVVALNLKGCKAFGIDIKDENIEISKLRARVYNLSEECFLQSDASRLPFRGSTFDIVIMNEVLEHVANIECVLSEVSRILKEKGLFFARVPNAVWPYEGHIALWFPHWLPFPLRKAYIKLFRKEKGDELNYLKEIRYLGYFGWKKVIQPYFKDILSSIKIYQKIFSTRGRIYRILSNLILVNPQFKLIEFLSPTIYLIARK